MTKAKKKVTKRVKKAKQILAWHIVSEVDGKPVTRDDLPVTVGSVIEHEGPIVICQSGLHASLRVIDAASYSPSRGEPWLCRVALEDVVTTHNDKLVARKRTVLAMAKATKMFQDVARQCADMAAEIAKMTQNVPSDDEINAKLADLFESGGKQLLGVK